MPLIIDANVANECLIPSADAIPIMQGLARGVLTCVTGHQHKQEMLACGFKRIYRQLVLAGRLKEFPDEAIATAEAAITEPLASNDGHIIALAQVSGARVLFSRDQPLHQDFTNSKLLSPKGKVYQVAVDHAHLLSKRYCG